MVDRLRELLAEGLQLESTELDEKSGPITIDKWDSLRHLMLIHMVEDEFGLQFSPEEIEKATSVGKIRALLEKHGVTG